MRDGSSDEALRELIARVWLARTDRYSEVRSENTETVDRVEMSYIGG